MRVWFAAMLLATFVAISCSKSNSDSGSGQSVRKGSESFPHSSVRSSSLPSPSKQKQAKAQRALANANAMVTNAAICEPQIGGGKSKITELQACQRACQLNHSNSCANWGALLESTDLATAIGLYKRACAGGSGIGCEHEAKIIASRGRDAQVTYLNARRYHRIHCEQGYARSCEQLARLFATGLGGPVSAGAARVFRQRACSLGRHSSCH